MDIITQETPILKGGQNAKIRQFSKQSLTIDEIVSDSNTLYKSGQGVDYFIHNLRITTKIDDIFGGALIQKLSEKYQLESTGGGKYSGVFWEYYYNSSLGINLYYNINKIHKELFTELENTESQVKDCNKSEYHILLEFPGSYLQEKSPLELCQELKYLAENNLNNVTRIDTKVRDWERSLTPENVDNWCFAGLMRRFQKHQPLRFDAYFNKQFGKNICCGATKYLGSRESGKFARIYDARDNHNVNAIDWEVEYKDNRAVKIVNDLIENYDNFILMWQSEDDFIKNHNYIIGNAVCQAVSFVEPSSCSVRTSRAGVLTEWQNFCDYVLAGENLQKISIDREPPNIVKTLNWRMNTIGCDLMLMDSMDVLDQFQIQYDENDLPITDDDFIHKNFTSAVNLQKINSSL